MTGTCTRFPSPPQSLGTSAPYCYSAEAELPPGELLGCPIVYMQCLAALAGVYWLDTNLDFEPARVGLLAAGVVAHVLAALRTPLARAGLA